MCKVHLWGKLGFRCLEFFGRIRFCVAVLVGTEDPGYNVHVPFVLLHVFPWGRYDPFGIGAVFFRMPPLSFCRASRSYLKTPGSLGFGLDFEVVYAFLVFDLGA